MHFSNGSEFYKVVGLNIKRYRKNARLTQMQLAEHSQISISHFSRIETIGCSKNLSISVLNQIADALSADITEFFGEM